MEMADVSWIENFFLWLDRDVHNFELLMAVIYVQFDDLAFRILFRIMQKEMKIRKWTNTSAIKLRRTERKDILKYFLKPEFVIKNSTAKKIDRKAERSISWNINALIAKMLKDIDVQMYKSIYSKSFWFGAAAVRRTNGKYSHTHILWAIKRSLTNSSLVLAFWFTNA